MSANIEYTSPEDVDGAAISVRSELLFSGELAARINVSDEEGYYATQEAVSELSMRLYQATGWKVAEGVKTQALDHSSAYYEQEVLNNLALAQRAREREEAEAVAERARVEAAENGAEVLQLAKHMAKVLKPEGKWENFIGLSRERMINAARLALSYTQSKCTDCTCRPVNQEGTA